MVDVRRSAGEGRLTTWPCLKVVPYQVRWHQGQEFLADCKSAVVTMQNDETKLLSKTTLGFLIRQLPASPGIGTTPRMKLEGIKLDRPGACFAKCARTSTAQWERRRSGEDRGRVEIVLVAAGTGYDARFVLAVQGKKNSRLRGV